MRPTSYKLVDTPAIASYLLAAFGLLLVLSKGLLAALFSGLLVYALVQMMAPALGRRISGQRAKVIAVAVLSTLIVAVLSGAIWWLVDYLTSDANRLSLLLQKLADVIESSRTQVPAWLQAHLPTGVDALRETLTRWMRDHALEARSIGEQAGRTIAHILIGMIIGAMAALHGTMEAHLYKPLAAALHARVVALADAFERIVFAQVRIAAINAVFTGLFLLVALPLAGVHLPMVKTLILLTFIAGLLPVVGNLISNTVLVVVGLSHSLHVAVVSLLFLITIHKVEYFLNAKIIGAHINARAWELLSAMLVMEVVFGMPGVIAAPVLYAYVKKELVNLELV